MNSVQEICTALREITECTVIMHRRPDGDTIGSSAALAMALRKLGKTVHLACADPITPKYRDLTGSGDLRMVPTGTIITVDVASPDMAGSLSDFAKLADIVIDHHATNPLWGKLNLVRSDAAAAGEVVYDIVKELTDMDQDIAYALYVAVATDTGCFRHGNTRPYTHIVAAELMKTGLDISEINRRLFVVKTRASLDIRSQVLQNMRYYDGGRIAVTLISDDMMKATGAEEDDVENISSVPMEIEGVSAGATLREVGKNRYKVSVRTDGSVDGSGVCLEFGGGGHAMAAGCTLEGTAEDCMSRMAEALSKAGR